MTKRNFLYILFSAVLITTVSAEWKERVQLETDQELYLAGETVYFSITTTDSAGRPAAFSKLAYLELVSEKQSEAQVMIDLIKPAGDGRLVIPDFLPTGYYRLVAYTRHMQNEGPTCFEHKLIAIVNPFTFNKHDLSAKGVKAQTFRPINTNKPFLNTDRKVYNTRSQGLITISNLPPSASRVSVVIHKAPYLGEAKGSTNLPAMMSNNSQQDLIAEYEGHIIRAKLLGDSSVHTDIFLSAPGKDPLIYRGQTENSGLVNFYTENGTLDTEIATVMQTMTSAQQVVEIQSPFADMPLAPLPRLTIDSTLIDMIQQRSIALQLKEAFQSGSDRQQAKNLTSSLSPYKTYQLDDYTRFPTLEEVIIEFVTNVRFRKIDGVRRISVNSPEQGAFTMGNSLVLLDNVPVFNHELLLQYNPLLMEKIDVFMGKYVFGGAFFDGIVSFNTYQRNLGGFQLEESTSIMSYPSVQMSHSFTAPNYSEGQQGEKHLPDTRHVLLWSPNINTEGRDQISIPFSTSDTKGSFYIHLRSLTDDGQTLHHAISIEVK